MSTISKTIFVGCGIAPYMIATITDIVRARMSRSMVFLLMSVPYAANATL